MVSIHKHENGIYLGISISIHFFLLTNNLGTHYRTVNQESNDSNCFLDLF